MYRISWLLVFSVCSSAFGTPVLDFNPQTGGTGRNNDQTVGWSFSVLDTLTVTDLAWFDQDQDGLSTAHAVAIWDTNGSLLTQATIPAGQNATLDGIWRLVPITPIQLFSGNDYVVGGLNTELSTDRLAAGITSPTVDSRIIYGGELFSDFTTSLIPPDVFSNVSGGFFGPSFFVASIPEPATWLLLSSAYVAIFIYNRRGF